MSKNYGKRLTLWVWKQWAKARIPLVWIISLGGFAVVVYQVCFRSETILILPRAWAFLILTGGVAIVAVSLTIISLLTNAQDKGKTGQ